MRPIIAIAILLVFHFSTLSCGGLFAQGEASSKPIALKIEPPFAWNRADRYEPPNFEAFFPDDVAAGKQLDLLLEGKLEVQSVEERLALVRRGLRNTTHHRTTLLGSIGNQFIWHVEPQDPRAIELMYHASSADPELAHDALYHGPTVVLQRSSNLVRMLMEQYQSLDQQMQGRIVWGMKTYGDKELTRQLLIELLNDYEQLDDATIGAAIDVYQSVFETPPPDLDRFENIGQWVIAFHRSDLSAAHPRAAQIFRDELDKPRFRNGQLQLTDFVTRVDEGREVAVALVQGVRSRDILSAYLAERLYATIDFVEMLSPRTLQERRLREFATHLPQGLPKSALPAYTRPPVDASYAYSAGQFVAPNYEVFFADDAAASAELDRVYEHRESIEISDRELLELFRRGVRRSAHNANTMFGWLSGALGWPRDPLLTEILYQGMDPQAPPETRKAAVYYGFGLGTSKTKNILEAMFQVYMTPPFDRRISGEARSRILWGVRDHEDDKHFLASRFAETLRNHAELSDEALVSADRAYRELTDMESPNAADYASRGVFVVILRDTDSRSAADVKQRIAHHLGDSKYLLESKIIELGGDLMVVAVVRGRAGEAWLIDRLRTAPGWNVHFMDLLTPELIDGVEDDLLRDFERYLPAQP